MIDNRETYRIEQLMSKFLSGDTTPAQERELEMFFSKTDPTELPEDMLSFREMMIAIEGCHPTAEEAQPPADLIEKLDAITETMPKVPAPRVTFKKSRLWLTVCILTGVAACLLPVLIFLSPEPVVTLQPAEQIARIEIPPTTEEEEVADEPQRHTQPATSPRKRVTKTSAKATRKSPAAKVEAPAEEPGFIEVTDPEEAAKIVEDIGKLLALNVEKTNHAISHLEQSIEYHREISKSLLQ